MKKIILFSVVFLQLSSLALAKLDNWAVAKSSHFIIYYKNASEDFIDGLIYKAETYYNEIADNLGFKRYKFWLWENRAKIYIHDDATGYQVATGSPEWSYGHVIPKDKVIHSFPSERRFFDTILPHELGHIIFREFVGFENNSIPLWLDEGVACYQENLRRPTAKRIVAQAMGTEKFISLEELSGFNIRSADNDEVVKIFYAEAVSIIDYLIKEFGEYRFVLFCRRLRDKRSFKDALSSSYPFKNIKQLDRAWQEFILE